jgi:CDGSH-type Zn-finger protein
MPVAQSIEDEGSIMARLVKRYRNEPHTVIVGGETLSICGCGLSATQPYCDGTHVISESEDCETVYWYDEAGERHVAVDALPGIRSDKQPQEA